MNAVTRDIDATNWKLTVPETGVTLTAPYAASLKRKVVQHLTANSFIPRPDFDAWFEDAACNESGLGNPWCGKAVPKPMGAAKHLTSAMVVRFVSTMLGVLRDRKFVSREEAERRIAICQQCPMASSVGFCHGCSAVMQQAKRLMKGMDLDVQPEKSVCASCGCYLALKAWIPNETLDRAESVRPPYAEGCWRRG